MLFFSWTEQEADLLATAIRCLVLAGNKGCTAAFFELALLYHRGFFVNEDEQAAIQYYEKAASGGHAGAQSMLAALCEEGSCGLTVDRPRALQLYFQASKQGELCAMNNLGLMYENGVPEAGVKADLVEAVGYFTKAAEGGLPMAMVAPS